MKATRNWTTVWLALGVVWCVVCWLLVLCWLLPAACGRVGTAGDPPEAALSDQERKQALYEDLKAAEPGPERWMSDPEGAKRAMDRIQAERKVLEERARKLRGP